MLRRLPLVARGYLLALLVTLGCSDSGRENDALIDPSFDDWCERNLCDWTTRQGRIEPATTWHVSDLGVSFVETPTEISQLLEKEVEVGGCLLFDTIADVAPEADVSILLDFNDDGFQEEEQRITGVRWRSVTFPVRTPVAYQGLRVSVIKRGAGRAILALMRIIPQSNCTSAALTLKDGSKCSQDAVCTSGLCLEGRCTSLTPSAGSE